VVPAFGPPLYLQKRYTWEGNVIEPGIEFDWDEANIGHVARHRVLPEEAEQVILGDPVDLGMEIVRRRRALSQPWRTCSTPI